VRRSGAWGDVARSRPVGLGASATRYVRIGLVAGSIMIAQTPHYHLISRSGGDTGRWEFILTASDGSDRLVAGDVEPEARGERLELLTVVRGLEALDQPSRVTLMTRSRYVREGIRYGLATWRKSDWCWEAFGNMVPIRDRDLWQRMDRAMKFHDVECRTWRIDAPHLPRIASNRGIWGRGAAVGCPQSSRVRRRQAPRSSPDPPDRLENRPGRCRNGIAGLSTWRVARGLSGLASFLGLR